MNNSRDYLALPCKEGRVYFDFFPLPRPMTKHWGSGKIIARIRAVFGEIDLAFGATDGIPDDILKIDLNTGFNWINLPFKDNEFGFGYWDPPYDKLYKPEGKEIWRVCNKLAILHTYIYPTSWFKDAIRVGMVAVTYGPLKQIRCLQIFEKKQAEKTLWEGEDER